MSTSRTPTGNAPPSAAASASDGPVRLDDQLCFALYATSRAITARYKPLLAEHGLTYPQYVTLLAVWEQDGRSVGELGAALDLDSGTLSPILKRLEAAGHIRRDRATHDERTVRIHATAAGRRLEAAMGPVRAAVEACTGLSEDEFADLRQRLHRLRETVQNPADVSDATKI